MDTATFWIRQQTQKFDALCASAATRVSLCKTMRDVVRTAQVQPPAEVRMLVRSLSGYRKLKSQTERRLEQLLAAQLAELALVTDPAERKLAVGRLRAKDWQALRGEFASLYRKADWEAQKLLAFK